MFGLSRLDRKLERSLGFELLRRLRRVIRVFFLMVLVFAVGMTGYMYLEGLSPFQAVYLTVMTIATVGYGDIVPHTFLGRIFSIIIVIYGGITLAYGLSVLVSFLVEVEIKDVLGVYRMKTEIMGKKGHIIVCGYGTVGQNVVEKLIREEVDFVVVEKEPAKLAELSMANIWAVKGDATIEDTLKEANIEKASGLITALSTDADNLIVAITARDLNPDIIIVSRVTRKNHIKRFISAGVERVVLPEFVGGTKLADAILKPRVTEFLGGTGLSESLVELDDIPVEETSTLADKSLKDLKIPQTYDIILAAIERTGELIIPPLADEVVRAGDILFMVGKKADLANFRKECKCTRKFG